MKKVIVIGGGAAGMMAAISASKEGASVTLIEKNEKTGKKIYITGKGRCNLTNACEDDEFFNSVVTNPKFLYSAYYGFNASSVMDLFEEAGLKLKIERGNRVFPYSDHSSDVIKTLNELLNKYDVNILLNTIVTSVKPGKVYTNKGEFQCDSVIIATGGISYSSTGSTGDGYKFAKDLQHEIKEPKAALVPLETVENDVPELQGLSLKNVNLDMFVNKKKIYSGFGEMLFTHFGISGPLVLTASSYIKANDCQKISVMIDLKPALSYEELDARVLRDFDVNKNKQFKNSLDKLLPQKIIPVVISRTGIDEEKKVCEITREERKRLVEVLKKFELHIKAKRSINEAIITQGGISVKDINPSTMESKLCPSIYFAGEVIDVDALTGGFNLQIAWSTGYLAGICASN